MRRLRILLVEDDALISELVAQLLQELGHDVCGTARTESDAIAAAEQHAPDLMIVDAILAKGGGVGAMDAILRRGAMPHIFITGGSRHKLPAAATVLQKPFGLPSLLAALERVATQIDTAQGGARPA